MRCLFVLILYIFFPLAAKLIGLRMGVNSLKNVELSDTYPLNLMSHLNKGVCVGFGDIFYRTV